MAYNARIRNLERLSRGGRDELKSVAADVYVGDLLRDFWHVAGDAFVSGASGLVMRVGLNTGRARSIRRMRTVTLKTQDIRRFQQIGIVFRAVDIVATEATHAVGVHRALHEIVALHAVLMRGAIGEMSERLLTQLVFFQLPEIFKVHSHLKADRPVVIFAAKRIVERLSLRMALDANVGTLHGVEPGWVNDIRL